MRYYKGDGTAKDDGEAMKWWCKSAAQGNEAAQSNLRMVQGGGTKKRRR